MIKLFITLFSISIVSATVSAQSAFKFQNKLVATGTKEHFMVPISTNQDTTYIPVTVFNGIRNGKTIGITAGVHGYEYAPIMAGQKLINAINPKELNGIIILVQIANVESFKGRSPYVSPIDRKNLNRSFPGSADGTNTEKVANFITNNIIARSDYFLDIHSGDAPEDLIHYSAYYSNSNMPKISSIGKEMAKSMGFDYLVPFDTDGKAYLRKDQMSIYCSAEAFKRGIPAADIECGGKGITEPEAIAKIEKGVLNMLGYLKFISPQQAISIYPKVVSNRIYIPSRFDGVFYPLKKAGDSVKKGTLLGYITDYFGQKLQDISAEHDGILMLILSTPPITKGEDVAVVGVFN